MKTTEQQAFEYGEALNDIADALDAPTGSSPAQVVELARKAMRQRQPSTDLVGAEAKRLMNAHEAAALDNSTNAEQMYWMRKYEQLEAEYKRLSTQATLRRCADAVEALWQSSGQNAPFGLSMMSVAHILEVQDGHTHTAKFIRGLAALLKQWRAESAKEERP